jgi:hypothetical protein
MLGGTVSSAIAKRDQGVKRISRLTWRATAVSLACSGIIAFAFGRHTDDQAARQPAGQHGSIVVPNQPPAPAAGGAPQVTSGAS